MARVSQKRPRARVHLQHLISLSGTSRATTSLTSVGSHAGSPEPIRGPSPTMGHEAEILDVYDPFLGYDAETCPYQSPRRTMRSPARAGLLGGSSCVEAAHRRMVMAQVWLVTGSASGLGRHIADAVLASGDRLVATARDPRRLADLVETYGGQVRTAPLGVADEEAAYAAVQVAVEAFGRLDVVVNN